MNNDQPCAFCQMTKNISDWFAHPFSTQGTAFDWTLTVGLVLVAVWMWLSVLHLIGEEV